MILLQSQGLGQMGQTGQFFRTADMYTHRNFYNFSLWGYRSKTVPTVPSVPTPLFFNLYLLDRYRYYYKGQEVK
jgi:hypothetical protein